MDDKTNSKWENGVKLTWDNSGNTFVSMPVNNIPKAQFDAWMKQCRSQFSGKRWDMIMAEHIKAQAYDAMMLAVPTDMPGDEIDNNPDGLLNGGR